MQQVQIAMVTGMILSLIQQAPLLILIFAQKTYKLENFHNNVAHSNGRYGLRIFHNLVPRTYPC
jgi:hypothetical protein